MRSSASRAACKGGKGNGKGNGKGITAMGALGKNGGAGMSMGAGIPSDAAGTDDAMCASLYKDAPRISPWRGGGKKLMPIGCNYDAGKSHNLQ